MDEQKITITLPQILVKQINKAMKDLGYESESEFFKEAARILLKETAEYQHFVKE